MLESASFELTGTFENLSGARLELAADLLGDALHIVVADGFQPVAGDVFEIITAGGATAGGRLW